jgi:hypothetical protein
MTPWIWIVGATLGLLLGLPARAHARQEQLTTAFSPLPRAELERLVAAGSRVLLLVSVASPGGDELHALAADVRQTLREMERPVVASIPAAADPTGPEVAALCARTNVAVLMRVRILTVDGRSLAELTTWQRTGTLLGTSRIAANREAAAPGDGPVSAPRGPHPPALGGGAPLSDARLYEALGRPDLAEATRARAVTRTTLAIGGGVLMLGGAGWWVAANFDSAIGEVADDAVQTIRCPSSAGTSVNRDPACTRPRRDHFDLPLVAVAGGTLMVLSAVILPADPVPAAEKLRLLQRQGLKRATTSDPQVAISFNAMPVLHREGGGLLLSGRF